MAANIAHKEMFRHCVGFFVDVGGPSLEIASGVLVSIQGRLFVATASHAIPSNPAGKLWLLPPRPRTPSQGMLNILNYGKTPGDLPDVGFLELQPEAALRYLSDKEAFPVERLKSLDVNVEHRLVILVGYPGEQVAKETIGQMSGFRAKSLGFATSTLKENEWPTSLPTNARAPDPKFDIFLAWPEDGQDTIDIETGSPMKLPHPGGTSGGGIWDFSGEKQALWTAQSTRLVAIQGSSGVAGGGFGRYIRATPIVHWLQLIHSRFVELRPTLEGMFPALKGLNP